MIVDDRPVPGRPRKATADESAAQRRLALLGMGALLTLAILAGAIGLWVTSTGDGGYAPPPPPPSAHAKPRISRPIRHRARKSRRRPHSL